MEWLRAWVLVAPSSLPSSTCHLPLLLPWRMYACSQTQGNGCGPGQGRSTVAQGSKPRRASFLSPTFRPLLLVPGPSHGACHPRHPEVTSPGLPPRTASPPPQHHLPISPSLLWHIKGPGRSVPSSRPWGSNQSQVCVNAGSSNK